MERGNFGTKIGIILATAGSAVGLGNVWRFPYMAGENGGAAFIVLYFGCILLLGIPGMVSEFIVGRHAQSNAYRAYGKMGGRPWRLVGILGILTSTIILGFYAVVAGSEQCRPGLRPAVGRASLEMGGLLGCLDLSHHPGLLCRGGWLVPAVPLCLYSRSA